MNTNDMRECRIIRRCGLALLASSALVQCSSGIVITHTRANPQISAHPSSKTIADVGSLQEALKSPANQSVADREAMAESMLRRATEMGSRKPQEALGLALMAANLADSILARNPGTASGQSRPLRLYNQATAKVVELLQKAPGGMSANPVVTAGERSFSLRVVAGDKASEPRDFARWELADEWDQRGLNHRFSYDGVGARLIAMQPKVGHSPLGIHQPDEGFYQPCTAVLRFEPKDDSLAGGMRKASLVLFNPAFTAGINFHGEAQPLAADYSLPWAMLLSKADALSATRWSALVRPGETPRPHRLYLMEPYAPDRIPLIMVHGLYSTPLTWAQMTNELMGDLEIRRRYQIWHYLYPTGLPFLISAAHFRSDLEEVRRLVDPPLKDYATQHMVIVAHSMGGLLTKTVVSESGDAIWNSTFTVPPSQLKIEPSQREALRDEFYFHPKPYVRRVIFLSVPHRGSRIADGWIGRMIASFVRIPDALKLEEGGQHSGEDQLLRADSRPLFKHGHPNSVQVLSINNPVLKTMATLSVDKQIPFHSIMGDRGRGDGQKSSDGVVTYASAHLEGAVSEKIVPCNHGSVSNAQAIDEVKRILRLHLEQ